MGRSAVVATLLALAQTTKAALPTGARAALPESMNQMRTRGPCGAPFDDCVSIDTVAAPRRLEEGEALIRVHASSVNPSDVDEVESGACTVGVCGADVSGVIEECNGCADLEAGDEVWTLARGAYADYVKSPETATARKPASVNHTWAGTMPEVFLTSFLSLKRTAYPDPSAPLPSGAPWDRADNFSVLVTAGSGGTGSAGIQLARAWGAGAILTAVGSDAAAEYVTKLGATYVTNYNDADIFSTLANNSVDYVFDNYGAEGTADLAMRVLRPGGVYLLLPHGECFTEKTQGPPCLSANPKEGVTQLNYATGPDFDAYGGEGLAEMATMVDAAEIGPVVDRSYALADIAAAFNYSKGDGEGGVSDHLGKISVAVIAD